MASQLYHRMASAAGLVALAFVIVGISPLLGGGDPAVGVGRTTPTFSVNRALKGDRLPVANPTQSTAPSLRNERGSPPSAAPRAQMPVGCDPAFSPISSPRLGNVYRRCMA